MKETPYRRAIFLQSALCTFALGLAMCQPAAAAGCDDHHPNARTAGSDPAWEEDDGWVVEEHGTVCTITDKDDGSMDYYTKSESACLSMPGFITWNKDRGAGFNRCIFAPPTDSGASAPGSYEAPSTPKEDLCAYSNDGVCDEPNICSKGSDTNDCQIRPLPPSGDGTATNPNSSSSSPFVNVSVCNKYTQEIFVAYGGKHKSEDSFYTISGWRRIQPDACSVLDRFVKSKIHIFAEDSSGNKWAGDKNFCVLNSKFDYLRDRVRTCERVEGFTEYSPQEDTFTINIK